MTIIMFNFNIDKMLYNIPAENHSVKEVTEILKAHPEVKFVSLVGIDIGGHDTDEKIPTKAFIEDMEKLLEHGVQTDGSSVVLPKIANLNNAKVDIIPDLDVNWYVDHNLRHIDLETGLPVGTLRIPAFLLHNDVAEVGSRVILRDCIKGFEKDLMELLRDHPYVFENMTVDSVEEIDHLVLTSATELEFWVKTPDEQADRREELSTAQLLKEQYWKRTVGPVRTALEKSLMILDKYDFEIEMGHKEVGGVKAKMDNSGHYDHVMEQLEIDWKFSTALQAADNENQVKYVVRDVFRMYGLDVTFNAKPMEGIAGSGEHTHMGVAAKLKNGKMVNLFSPKDVHEDFLSPVGFGALMGLLKNYDIINPFVSSTNDSFNRLKPGYEAPVCVVTSLGHSVNSPSRNRTVLAGLVRDQNNTMATRFELRSPNPKSNTYLVIAASYMAMLDGIKAALEAKKTSKELEKSLCKAWGEEDFYLEKDRLYRSELNVFDEYTPEERDELFGRAPRTVWENLCALTEEEERVKIFQRENVMTKLTIESYKAATLAQWATELHNRIVPNTMDLIRRTTKRHKDGESVDYDVAYWSKIDKLRNALGRDTLNEKCLLTRIVTALDEEDYQTASDLQIKMQGMVEELTKLYTTYKKNLF
ncbi:MAG: glutamine synthetase [Anaerovoracaceae bacterium]